LRAGSVDERCRLLKRGLVVLAVALLVLSGCADPLAGSPGRGDRYLPKAGNGGYDVLHYDLDLTVDPATGQLEGNATISVRATQDLVSFNLDFTWAGDLDGVTVDGAAADWETGDGELKVVCPDVVDVDQEFVVSVT
jgi:hypothetical protein